MLNSAACVRPTIRATLDNPTQVDVSRLWNDPDDVAQRDLFYGPGGEALVPNSSTPFTFVSEDRSGYSPGFDVRDPAGMVWAAKLGPEAQPEVAVSRILWAIGFHQPPTYYVPAWTMTGDRSGPQPAGRFRPELPNEKVVGDWSWYENDFVATQPFKAVVLANLMLNNWDWKTSNNKIYEVTRPGGSTERVYVVRDLGASLGKTSFPRWLDWFPMRGMGQGSRNDLEDFESQGFIKRVADDRVEFFYRGIHPSLVELISRDDVIWTCRLMARLTDAQWRDAFRAAGYSANHAQRFVTKIKAKIAQGLKLAEA
jgi:hypothetical protein